MRTTDEASVSRYAVVVAREAAAVLMAVLMIVLLAAPAAAGQARNADTRAWYQAYQDGVRQVQQRNWQAAITSLLAAKRAGPAPGRRIPFYGDVFDDYLPDYYLGLSYMNTLQYTEAAAAFDAVQKAGLITAKDREYPELTRQTAAVRSELSKRLAAQAQTSPTQPPVSPAAPIRAPNTLPEAGNPPSAQVASVDTKADTPAASLIQSSPPIGQTAATAVPTKRPIPTRPTPAQNTQTASATALASESAGMAAFFAGDYQGAANILTKLALTGRTPRAEFYLACSRAALVLTGMSDPTTLTNERARFSAVDATQFTADQRYISPRILQTLRAAQ